MSRVRNKTGDALFVPELGKVVQPGEIVDVPADRLEQYIIQTETWADESKRKKEEV